jgi:hypothetical protein
LFASILACANATRSATLLPEADRVHAARHFDHQLAYLHVTSLVAPFFGEPRKRLLSPAFIDELRLEDDAGRPLVPKTTEKVLPAGTRVRIDRLEFPTGLDFPPLGAVASRPKATPRSRPWVYLSAEGQPADHSLILVLRKDLGSFEDVTAELERYLSPEPLDFVLGAYPEPIRRAIAERRVVTNMDPGAVEMAWGYPERRTIVFREQGRDETWTWPSGKRRVFFTAGRVTKAESEPRP